MSHQQPETFEYECPTAPYWRRRTKDIQIVYAYGLRVREEEAICKLTFKYIGLGFTTECGQSENEMMRRVLEISSCPSIADKCAKLWVNFEWTVFIMNQQDMYT